MLSLRNISRRLDMPAQLAANSRQPNIFPKPSRVSSTAGWFDNYPILAPLVAQYRSSAAGKALSLIENSPALPIFLRELNLSVTPPIYCGPQNVGALECHNLSRWQSHRLTRLWFPPYTLGMIPHRRSGGKALCARPVSGHGQ